MNYTDNYTLKLPSSEGEFSDVADINDLNENFIAIDSELAKKTDKEEIESNLNDAVVELSMLIAMGGM